MAVKKAIDVPGGQLSSVDKGRFQRSQAGPHLGQAIHNFQQDRFHATDDNRTKSRGRTVSKNLDGLQGAY